VTNPTGWSRSENDPDTHVWNCDRINVHERLGVYLSRVPTLSQFLWTGSYVSSLLKVPQSSCLLIGWCALAIFLSKTSSVLLAFGDGRRFYGWNMLFRRCLDKSSLFYNVIWSICLANHWACVHLCTGVYVCVFQHHHCEWFVSTLHYDTDIFTTAAAHCMSVASTKHHC